MPSPIEKRKQAINQIVEYFEKKGTKPKLIDPILFRVKALFPELTEETAKSYAVSVMYVWKAQELDSKANGEV